MSFAAARSSTGMAASLAPLPKEGGRHAWKFLLNPEDTWASMYQDCRAATESIDFEQYIFRNDRLGRKFLALFLKKSREGVKVRVIFDMFGSIDLYFSSQVKVLRRAGVRLRFFNPLTVFQIALPWTWFPRTHAKTMVIDSHILYTGGVCFDEGMRNWRDTQVRVEGVVAHHVRTIFDLLWKRPGWHLPRRIQRSQRIAERALHFRFVVSRPHFRRNPIYRELREQIRMARRRILIASPFFIPTRSFLRLLKEATARGIQVSILVSDVSDVRFADWVTRSFFPALLDWKIHVFLYRPTVFHAKYMVVDDDWATVGSMNLDYLSAFRNRETNLVLTEPEAVAELAAHFEKDIQSCYKVTSAHWQETPLLPKIAGFIGRSLRAFL